VASHTPLRALPGEVVDGVHLLVAYSTDWRDGGEDEIFETLGRVQDRSTLSDELRRHELSWEAGYHLSCAGLTYPPTRRCWRWARAAAR
jgi:hypothetical protein